MPNLMELAGFRHYLIRSGVKRPSYYVTIITCLNDKTNLQEKSVLNLFDSLLEAGRKPSSINRYLAVVKAYGRYKHWEWVENLQKFKEDVPKVGLLSDDEIEKFLDLAPPPNTPIDSWHSWTVFFSIMAYTGMRCGEVAKLEAEDVDFKSNNFLLWETKTSIPRRVPIPQIIKQLVSEFIDGKTGLLFAPKRADNRREVLLPQTWRRHFIRRLAILGIHRKYLKPYSMRHSYITSMLSEGVGIEKVGKIVGHRNIKTTMGYTHLVNKDIQNVINEHPICKKSRSSKDLFDEACHYVQERGLAGRDDVVWTMKKDRFILKLIPSV